MIRSFRRTKSPPTQGSFSKKDLETRRPLYSTELFKAKAVSQSPLKYSDLLVSRREDSSVASLDSNRISELNTQQKASEILLEKTLLRLSDSRENAWDNGDHRFSRHVRLHYQNPFLAPGAGASRNTGAQKQNLRCPQRYPRVHRLRVDGIG
jgi:hypothetical protein